MGIEAVSIGKLSDFGPRLEGPLSTIVNEGPVGLMDLRNTVPLQIGQQNPITEINFQPQPELNASDVVAEAESILVQAQIPQPKEISPVNIKPAVFEQPVVFKQPVWEAFLPQVEPVVAAPLVAPNIVEFPKSQIVTSPALEPGTQTENALGVQVGSQPKLEGGEKLEKEEVVTEKVIKKETDMMEEEISKERNRYLVDKLPLAQRIYEVRQAVKKAKLEAKGLGLGEKIIGTLVARFMPAEHTGIRSSIVQPNGPDGSYEETIEVVKAGQFDSEDQVEEVVLNNIPVKEGKDGKPVKDEAVWKVLKYWMVKRVPAHEIVTSRVVKKRVQAEEVKVKKETNLEELSPTLAEVFQKTA